LGHAVETATGYGTYRHGEAVALGMVAAARLAVRRGSLSSQESGRLVSLLQRAGLPVELPRLEPQALLAALKQDKKVRQGRLQMILPLRLGEVRITPVVIEELLTVIN
jgi:3-dehydroquinate synthase